MVNSWVRGGKDSLSEVRQLLVIRPKDLARKWCWTGTGREGMKWAGT